MDGAALTQGHLLNGRIDYAQPQDGYRTGIEPVFLAAAVPARPGERVLEAGTGAGAGLLCLAARIGGITGLGIEIEPRMAAVARRNFEANGATNLTVTTADICDLPSGTDRLDGSCDHAMANPPWHPASGTRSTVALRARAKVADIGMIAAWTRALGQTLRYHGSLTLILPARQVPEALAALPAAGCGSPRLFPLWPRAGQPARMLILQAIRGGRAEFRMEAGLVLHQGTAYTPAAEAVLRDGAALPLG